MPRRHSKNNNDLAFFTYDEKRKLGYGTQKERLGKDSIKPFDACCLCLKSLINPMSCQKGHLFCKECILQCLVSEERHSKICSKRKSLDGPFSYLSLFLFIDIQSGLFPNKVQSCCPS